MAGASFDELSVFLAVLEHRSFRRAANALGVSPSAVSHALRALENRTGARLIARTTRTVAPTDRGARFADLLRPAMAGIADSLATLAEADTVVRGSVRISAAEPGAAWLIDHVLPVLSATHPLIDVEIAIEPALVDLAATGSDAGIRLREQVPPTAIAIPIGGPVRMVAVASPDYLARHRPPLTPRELTVHSCIRQRLATGAVYAWEFERGGRKLTVVPAGKLTLGSAASVATAAARGLGIGFVPSPVAAPHVAAGRLRPLLERFSPPFDGFCLFFPRDRHRSRAVAALVAAVREAAAQARPPDPTA